MSYPPDPTCTTCDTELTDLDMAEDDDGRQYSTGRCPRCEPTMREKVALLNRSEFDNQACYAGAQLARHGHVYVSLSPGDGTRYEISIISPPMRWQHDAYHRLIHEDRGIPLTFQQRFSGSYFVATQFGPLYRWEGHELHPSYVYEKMTRANSGTDMWTAHVLARFLTELVPYLPAKPELPDA